MAQAHGAHDLRVVREGLLVHCLRFEQCREAKLPLHVDNAQVPSLRRTRGAFHRQAQRHAVEHLLLCADVGPQRQVKDEVQESAIRRKVDDRAKKLADKGQLDAVTSCWLLVGFIVVFFAALPRPLLGTAGSSLASDIGVAFDGHDARRGGATAHIRDQAFR